jgi:hypothetical protein
LGNQILTRGKDIVEKVTLKFDNAGRSLGVAELLFKSFLKAKEYRDKFNGETLDGLALEIQLLRPFRNPKVEKNSSNISVFDRLGGNKGSKVGKKSNGIADRLGPKKGSILDRLGEKKKSIKDRLGKTLDQRLGAVGVTSDDVVVPKKKKNRKKKAKEGVEEGRTVTSYAEVVTDQAVAKTDDVQME